MNNELYHHGILGQKWGRRNGPPYPLQAGDHSSSERKAGWKKSLSGNNSDSSKSVNKKTKKDKVKKFIDKNAKKIEEKRRRDILKDPKKLNKHRDEFSEREINDALRRFDLNRRLRDASIDQMNTGKKYADLALGYMQTALKIYTTLNAIDKIGSASKNQNEKVDKSNKSNKVENNPKREKLKKFVDYALMVDDTQKTRNDKQVKDLKKEVSSLSNKAKAEAPKTPLTDRINNLSKMIDDIDAGKAPKAYAKSSSITERMKYLNSLHHSEELYHHGILGMKWGRRNGPPYPLQAGDHSASERKAGWRKSLDSKETRLRVKKAKNSAKIEKAKARIASNQSLEREKREAQLNRTITKYGKSASKAAVRNARPHLDLPHPIQNRALRKVEKAQGKLANLNKDDAKQNVKISKLELKNKKIDDKLQKLSKKRLSEVLEESKNKLDSNESKNSSKGWTKQYGDYEKRVNGAIISLNPDNTDDNTTFGFGKYIEDNTSSIKESAKKAIVDSAFREGGRLPWTYEDKVRSGSMSIKQAKKEFKKDLDKDSTPYIYVSDVNRGLGEISFDDGGSYYGHRITIEADFKNKKYDREHYISG